MNYQLIKEVTKAFSEKMENAYSYAFVAGYYQSMLESIIPELPEERQEELVLQLVRGLNVPAACKA